MRNFAKKILIAGSVLVAAVMAAIPAHAQVSQQNYWNLANQTLTPLISTWQVGNSNTNAAFNNLTVTGTCTGCGSGGGSGSGGTFSTSTSQVPGHLNNYANNTTDIVEVGGNSTSTAKFIFDPNSLIEYVSGSIGIGTKSPNYNLEVNGTASTTVLNIGKLTGPLQGTAGLVSVAPLGSLFSTTSANYWSSQGLGFSTTSNAFWLTLNQGNAFSTTSANYWGGTQGYLTSAVTTLTAGTNITFSSGGTCTSTCTINSSGSGGAYPFTPSTFGSTNTSATSTAINDTAGLISTASSTISLLTSINATSTNATTTNDLNVGKIASTTNLVVSSVGENLAGTFLAADPSGNIIATTTPTSGASASGTSAPVQYATVTGLPSYTASGGVITEVGTGALSVDGNSPSVGQRILVKNESGSCTSSAGSCQNGIYTVTATGSGIAAFVITRATDYNSSANVYPGIATYVIGGATLNDDWWAMTSAAPITIGTTGLTYLETSGGGASVASVSNSDSSLTISPTTGSVIASINLAHGNTFTANQALSQSVNGDSKYTITNTSSGANADAVLLLANNTGDIGGVAMTSTGYTPAGSILPDQAVIYSQGSNGITFENLNGGNITFDTSTSNGPQILVNQAGNLGIGSTTPWAKLAVGIPVYSATQPMFAVSSSTASGTTTPFEVDNNGVSIISKTLNLSALTGTQCLHEVSGIVSGTGSDCGAGGGGITRNVSSTSISVTAGSAASTDYTILASTTLTVTLPTAVGNTNLYTIENVGPTGATAIKSTSSQTMDGTSTPVYLPYQYEADTFQSDNGNWYIISNKR